MPTASEPAGSPPRPVKLHKAFEYCGAGVPFLEQLNV